MFSGDPAAVCPRTRTVCTVSSAAHFIVHTPEGTRTYSLAQFALPETLQIANIHGTSPADHSDQVRHALEQLHAQLAFEAIEFAAAGGLGFRTLQAKQAGLAFQDVEITVCLDDCRSWQREQRGEWVANLTDLETEFMERYAWEHADQRLAPQQELLTFVERLGWHSEPTLPTPITTEAPLVTVCVPYYNMGAFLPETLASLASQTYANLEVLVIDDGSPNADAQIVFQAMRARYPQFRFLSQPNAGIGATRNRGLREAKGRYFLPVDADNVAHPHMVERLVRGMERRPHLAALTCYFLAFADSVQLAHGDYLYACRPTGGCQLLASLRNVYGDANALYRTEMFRAVGGYETDRHTSFEDWEAFVKLARANYALDVLPDYLFYYRHLQSGFSRSTDPRANHQRVLRQFRQHGSLPTVEQALLWDTLVGFQQRVAYLEAQSRCRRYQWADRLYRVYRLLPMMLQSVKRLLPRTRSNGPGPPVAQSSR